MTHDSGNSNATSRKATPKRNVSQARPPRQRIARIVRPPEVDRQALAQGIERIGACVIDLVFEGGANLDEQAAIVPAEKVQDAADDRFTHRRFRRDVAADVAGERELLEELLHAFRIFALVRIDLGFGAFEICWPQHPGRAMARPGHENHIEVVFHDHPVEMHPNERQRRARAPVAEQPVFHIFSLQGLLEQWVILEIDHSHRKVIARPPIGVHQFQLFIG